MLERASACLDSGVRLSVRAQRRAPKSRRLLHSTFWQHAAPDVELPPCLLSPICPAPPASNHSQPHPHSHSQSQSQSQLQPQSYPNPQPRPHTNPASQTHSHPQPRAPHELPAATTLASPPDGPFLDFLYPAQTLAFMTRVSSSHLDRIWDRRAAHKASATTKGLRGYSSMTAAGPPPSLSSSQHREGQTLPPHYSQPRPGQYPLRPSDQPNETLATYRPGLPIHLIHNPLEELSHLIKTHQHGPEDDALVSRAWDLYATLNEKERRYPYLLKEYIIWLSRTGVPVAHGHIIRLFAALAQQSRDAATFHAVVGACIGTGDIKAALDLHEEAMQHAPNELVGADHLMLHAVTHEDWDMVRRVLGRLPHHADSLADSHLIDPGHVASPASQSLLIPPQILATAWSKLSLAPNLGDKLRSLAQAHHSAADDNDRAELLNIFLSIARSLLRSAIRNPTFTSPGHQGNVARASLRDTFLGMHKTSLPSAELYEYCLLELMAATNSAIIEDLSTTVAFVYKLYRQSHVFQPSRPLLQSLVCLWRDQRLALGGRGSKSSFVSLRLYLDDMKTFHDGPNDDAMYTVMECLSRLGYVQGVREYAQHYKNLHPTGLDTSAKLWPLVYVHAKRADPTEAKKQLLSMKAEYGVHPDLRCWNIVIHAYEEADEVEGALETLHQLLTTTTLTPDPYSFAPLLTLHARQGDVDRANDIIGLAKSHGITPNVHMMNSLIVAHVNNGELDRAEQILEEAVKLATARKEHDSLTLCFNTILTGHALRRDIESTMTVYRRMKDEEIPLDANTYGALVQVLCFFRQTDVAHRLVRNVMSSDRIRPLALHYALLMAGYVNQGFYEKALELETEMKTARVRPNNSTRTVLLKAKSLLEHERKGGDRKYADDTEPVPLQETIDELTKLLNKRLHVPVVNEPIPGLRGQASADSVDASFLVFIHGKRRVFDAALKISEMYTSTIFKDKKTTEDPMPIRLIAALMSVHFRARDYEEVDRYWALAVSQAESFRISYSKQLSLSPKPLVAQDASTTKTGDHPMVQIPTASRFLLSRPLRYYLGSQFSQPSTRPSGTMTIMVSTLLSKGYRFDNRTWNAFIVHLCRCSPPRALLAFALAEKFLIDNWPGWVNSRTGLISNRTIRPKASARAEGMEYIRNPPGNSSRYRSPGTLVPQYKTMVYLASALLELRNLEATGAGAHRAGQDSNEDQREIERQVGSMRDIRDRAPRTLEAVQRMPRVNDRLQRKLIRRS